MNFLAKNHQRLLWIIIFIYVVIFVSLCLWKYNNLGYNSIDLGIINQAFYNTAHGLPFASSIHPPSYLGDHFKPILFLLLPIYFFFQSPITLLILQTIFLALAAWPLYLISKNIFSDAKYYLLLPVMFLLSPFIHNINVFEFHFLPLCFFLFFFAFYFYQKNKFWPFLSFIFLGLMVREDAALFVFCFGLFIILDKYLRKEKIPWRWVVTTLVLSVVYFFLALKIISLFSPNNESKFLLYYAWLGGTLPELIKNTFLHPIKVLLALFRPGNLELLLALFLPFCFLPLLKPRYLLLGAATYFQLGISNLGASLLIIQLHYVTLLVIPLFIGSVYIVNDLTQKRFKKYSSLLVIILLIATIYSEYFLGFGLPGIQRPELVGTKQELLREIPAGASVVTSYDFLAPLSSRAKVYSLNYSFLGRKQLSSQPYSIPADTEYFLADLAETVTYQMQYEDLSFYTDDYFRGPGRLRQLIADNHFGLKKMLDTTVLLQKNYPTEAKFYTLTVATPADDFTCAKQTPQTGQLAFTCSAQFWQTPKTNYQLELVIKKDGKNIYSRLLPLAYGFYGTAELQPQQKLSTSYDLTTGFSNNSGETCINLVKIEGDLGLDKMGSTYNYLRNKEILKTSCL